MANLCTALQRSFFEYAQLRGRTGNELQVAFFDQYCYVLGLAMFVCTSGSFNFEHLQME